MILTIHFSVFSSSFCITFVYFSGTCFGNLQSHEKDAVVTVCCIIPRNDSKEANFEVRHSNKKLDCLEFVKTQDQSVHKNLCLRNNLLAAKLVGETA